MIRLMSGNTTIPKGRCSIAEKSDRKNRCIKI